MQKPDFPALLPPGMHAKSLQEIYDLAVAPFPDDARRSDLFRKLSVWSEALVAAGVTGTVWIDGSFLTAKPSPGDIDCVIWNPNWRDPAAASVDAQQQVARLLDHATAEAIYDLDLYLETPAADQVFHREAYWRGILGSCHDRVTAKGFAEVTI
ncbi:DUF6932 family protein [Pseudomonas sp. 32A]|uniref:DUF6932 family protein n=1 Tax=Pseudomonas sp. 32A TaxID=651185 RepID=UPI00404570B4